MKAQVTHTYNLGELTEHEMKAIYLSLKFAAAHASEEEDEQQIGCFLVVLPVAVSGMAEALRQELDKMVPTAWLN